MADRRLATRVHFVLDPRATRWSDIESLDAISIARAPRRFAGGRNSWIAQSFLRLRPALEARGLRITAGPGFVPGAICVVHRDDLDRFTSAAHASFLVAVRADRAPVEACDLAIAQNALDLRPNERYLPLWPQPGLIARDSTRGAGVRTLAYFGRTSSAPPWFHDEAWRHALARRGVRFEIRERNWHDYRDVDVALAARDEARAVLATKPATKLYNGWLARVPVLAHPEPAYGALRRDPLDFLETREACDVLDAIERLQREPRLFAAMVENGIRRGGAFSVEAVAQRWLRLFDDQVLPAFEAWRADGRSRRAWFLRAMLRQKVGSRLHRLAVDLQRSGSTRGAGPPAKVTFHGTRPIGLSSSGD
ncbi:MAG TPA: hypothetical protein VFE23_07070 [Usitatibacter sp.]|nr:hypothetical protein [Usitatibacter sp.]